MQLAPSVLRRILRNGALSGGVTRFVAALVLTGCARLAGLEPTVQPLGEDLDDHGGSPVPMESLPPDETLPPPPPTDCGDVASSATNCGWCGHSCRGLTCVEGRCEQEVVARGNKIESFVTNGTDLFVIDGSQPLACDAAGPPSRPCQPVIDPAHVLLRFEGPVIVEPEGNGGPGGPGGPRGDDDDDDGRKKINGGLPSALSAKAIALHEDRVIVADETYHAILSCPTKAKCDDTNLGILDVRTPNGGTRPLGKALAVGPSGVTWTQGEELLAGRLPAGGADETPLLSRKGSDTERTARIIAPAGIFWLAKEGLHHAPSIETPSERWSSREAIDFAVADAGVYVANKAGLLRVARTDRRETIAAVGDFRRVAVEGNAVYATRAGGAGGSTSILEIRADAPLEVAVVPGSVDALVVTTEYVYFATNGEIRRVAR